jgi:hypothetical protein
MTHKGLTSAFHILYIGTVNRSYIQDIEAAGSDLLYLSHLLFLTGYFSEK